MANVNELPVFSLIEPARVVADISRLISESRVAVERLLDVGEAYSWATLIEPLENIEDKINKTWSPIGHLNSVKNSEAFREAYNACLPILSEYTTDMGQNGRLFEAYRLFADSEEYKSLGHAEKRVVENALRDFRLSGVHLPSEQKKRFKEIAQELSRLGSRFQDNLLDATQAWTKLIVDERLLEGLPATAKAQARDAAKAKELTGWLFTLDFPSYFAVVTHASDRSFREEMYTAYVTRASERGPDSGKWDNTEIMEQLLALRYEEARLLGYADFAELSLSTKMASSAEEVIGFLYTLADSARPQALRDLAELREFAKSQLGLPTLEAWDIAYVSEKLKQSKYSLSEEEVREYFPASRVIHGLFLVVEQLFGLKIQEESGVDLWHQDVIYYEIHDERGDLRGAFYLDLYARSSKRGGAWMDECISRRRSLSGKLQIPVAFLTCNFTPPSDGGGSGLLRHDEVVTLFHEFGHGLQHMLTKVDCLGVSGIHGVEWDAVELPSQFMENFCWEPEALKLISAHYQTGESLPHALLQKMVEARNFLSGMQMLRQIEFSLFDFVLHKQYDLSQGGQVYSVLQSIREQVSVLRPPEFNRFAHSFSHIFGGGYAAGYYSYKWAEVLSSDAFSLFEEEGVFNKQCGAKFLSCILESGGTRSAMDLFVAFRGREPRVDALLRHNGIEAAA
jgi:oligopeptidase A